MSCDSASVKFKLRRGIASLWPGVTLAEGEPGYDTTNNILKIGQTASGGGLVTWANLPAINAGVATLIPVNTTISGISTTLVLTLATSGTYYSITTSSLTTLTISGAVAGTSGNFWVLRNNTSTYLSLTVGITGGGPSWTPGNPLVIPPSNSVTIVWVDSSTYVLF
jgi:hypothetical protein